MILQGNTDISDDYFNTFEYKIINTAMEKKKQKKTDLEVSHGEI